MPRDVASRNAKAMIDEGRGVGPRKNGVYLDFADAIERLGRAVIADRYGNLFEMYERITGENPYEVPMRIYPAPHYTMGGLWVDYDLMSTLPGLFVIGEANFSDHGANRLGASALMQGLADGYFILPYTLGNYLAGHARRAARRRPPGLPPHRGRGARAGGAAARAPRASAPSTPSTASWATSCGTAAACRAPPTGSTRRSSRSPPCARSTGPTSRCWAPARS